MADLRKDTGATVRLIMLAAGTQCERKRCSVPLNAMKG